MARTKEMSPRSKVHNPHSKRGKKSLNAVKLRCVLQIPLLYFVSVKWVLNGAAELLNRSVFLFLHKAVLWIIFSANKESGSTAKCCFGGAKGLLWGDRVVCSRGCKAGTVEVKLQRGSCLAPPVFADR